MLQMNNVIQAKVGDIVLVQGIWQDVVDKRYNKNAITHTWCTEYLLRGSEVYIPDIWIKDKVEK